MSEFLNKFLTASDAFISKYGGRIVIASLILVIGFIVAKWSRIFVGKAMRRAHADVTLSSFVSAATYIVLLTLVIASALDKLGVQPASLIAILGAAGLAIGLALQGTLTNVAAGVLIIIFKPFRVGDFVSTAETKGTVVNIGIFNTELKTLECCKVIIPNSKLVSENITNYSSHESRMIVLTVQVAYKSDLSRVKQILADIMASDERIFKEPPPQVFVTGLGDNAINISIRPWVKNSDFWPVTFWLNETVKNRFDDLGIEIPFPQRTLHVVTSTESLVTTSSKK